MARAQSRFVCQACGAEFLRWEGQCRSCSEWNTLVETVVTARPRAATAGAAGRGLVVALEPVPLSAPAEGPTERLRTGLGELDRVLGGGIVPGSLLLIGGEPGVGKSTLLLQVAGGIAHAGARVLYATGEESAAQPLRAEAHLRCCFLAADIDDRFARLREPSGRLQKKRRFADPRIAADQCCRSRNEAAAERTVELGDPAQHPFGHLADGIERFERQCPPALAKVVLGGKDGGRRFFDQCVPLAAIGALPLPTVRDSAAILADILTFRFGHDRRLTGTKNERQQFPVIIPFGQVA